MFPGVLQVEAVGQAGILLHLLQARAAPAAGFGQSARAELVTNSGGCSEATAANETDRVYLTHVLGARFLRPVGPEGELEVAVAVFADGLFCNIVGQCIHDGAICSVAAAAGLAE